MSHNPPLFKNFGKSYKDLIEKKFEFNREVKVKTTTLNGVTFESAGRAGKASDYTGALKVTYKRSDFGTVETEVDTDGNGKASVEADQLKKGVVVKFSGTQALAGNVDVAYRREYAAVSGGVSISSKATALDASGAVGYDGLFVGGAVKYDGTQQLCSDYNAGAEYAQPDFTVTVKTTDRAEKVTASYVHNLNPDVSVGAGFNYNIANTQRLDASLALVGSYAIDRDTTVKGKFVSTGTFTAALEQRLYNPKLKYGLAGEFNLKNQSAVPEKFGFALTFGEN